MRNLLALIFAFLFVTTCWFYACGEPFQFRFCLHHEDGSEGAEVFAASFMPREIEIATQLDTHLLHRQYREHLVQPGVGSLHVLIIPPECLFPLFALYPLLWLLDWWQRRGRRKRGFPVTLK